MYEFIDSIVPEARDIVHAPTLVPQVPGREAFAGRDYAPPVGALETAIAEVLVEVLKVERVGRHDNFFELGGHSLLALDLVEHLRQIGHVVDVPSLLASPSVAGIAAAARTSAPPIQIPPNLIPPTAGRITPDMLSLVRVTQAQIDQLVAQVPGGLANIQDIYPLAPLQAGILFHQLLEADGDGYLMRSVLSFASREVLDKFIAALQQVIQRHDILRSAVHWEGLREPVQVVHRHAVLEVRELSVSAGEAVLPALLSQCDSRPQRLDLRRAPILSALSAWDEANQQWLLALLRHHMAADHVTLELILSEIRLLLAGRGAELPAALPYRNFIARTHALSPREHEEYFRRELSHVQEPTAPFGVLDVQGDGGAAQESRLELSAELSRRIRAVARQQGVTPAVLFHVGWAQVLSRCCGQSEVVFGTVLSGRLQVSEGADQGVGMFINTLPIRLQVGKLSVAQAVRESYERLGELLRHEQASLALAQRCSAVPAPLPLFSTLLNYRYRHGDPAERLAMDSSLWRGVQLLSSGETRNNYPLTMSVEDWGQHFGLTALAVAGIDGTRMMRYLETMMEALTTGSRRQLSELPMLPASERATVLRQFNASAPLQGQGGLIHELFEAQVRAHPQALAVMSGSEQLSYAQLNARANQVAHWLRRVGVKPDARVALCVQRSVWLVVGMLGILKAGGAYVPLDPSYPYERLEHMLSDSGAMALLTQHCLRDSELSQGSSVPLMELDGCSDESQENLSAEQVGLEAHHLAYVIYTSGSTGVPKGVMVEHRSAVNFWQVLRGSTHARCAPGSRVGLNASFSFDMSLKGLLQLLSGHCVVVIPQAVRASGAELLRFIEQQRIDVMDSTPSQLEGLLNAGLLEAGEHRPCSVLLGGEAIGGSMWERLKASGLTEFHNMYGPTECTVDATLISLRECTGGPVIGRPIANAQIYILDEHREPVPIGVRGEIYIGGAGVARGYLNRAELTGERFLADPFNAGRMYQSGDVGRWLPDGTIEYLGRNDQQVKIRGFRIELGEIEAKLLGCAGVSEAVVLARQETGEKRLVAYVVAGAGVELSAAELREQLARGLSEYMIPSAFVRMERLPLTANGKLDRNALPAPDGAAAAARAYQPPQGSIEQKLAQLWCRALGVQQVGRSDHFFELGGHSLLVLSLMARIEDEFGVSVPRSTLVANLDLASQANAIVASQVNAIAAAASGMPPADNPPADNPMVGAPIALWTAPAGGLITGGLIRALPAQKALYKAIRYQPQNLGNISWMVLAFDPANPPHPKVLQSLLQSVLSRHESLRSRFVIEQGELYLEPAKRFVFRLEKRQSLGSVELDLRDFVRPFFLEDGMNVRGRWVSGDDQFLLLLNLSHACIDGAGMTQLLQTLVAGGDASSMMGSVAAYSALFYSEAFARLRAEHAGFWRDRLHDYTRRPTVSSLPAVTGSWRIVLGADLKATIGTLTARLQISAHEFFVTAFLRFKARLDDDHEQLVSMMFHGRDRLEQRAVIAPLMVQLPLRLSLSGDAAADLIEVAAAVRQAQRYYLFDADSLSATYPDLSREVLSPAALFGYYLKDAFSGRIAGASCRVLEVPDIGSAASIWRLTCEVVEHPLGFDVNIEADRYEASCATTDTAALFKEVVDGLLGDGSVSGHARTHQELHA